MTSDFAPPGSGNSRADHGPEKSERSDFWPRGQIFLEAQDTLLPCILPSGLAGEPSLVAPSPRSLTALTSPLPPPPSPPPNSPMPHGFAALLAAVTKWTIYEFPKYDQDPSEGTLPSTGEMLPTAERTLPAAEGTLPSGGMSLAAEGTPLSTGGSAEGSAGGSAGGSSPSLAVWTRNPISWVEGNPSCSFWTRELLVSPTPQEPITPVDRMFENSAPKEFQGAPFSFPFSERSPGVSTRSSVPTEFGRLARRTGTKRKRDLGDSGTNVPFSETVPGVSTRTSVATAFGRVPRKLWQELQRGSEPESSIQKRRKLSR
jgi:hypothetical protein